MECDEPLAVRSQYLDLAANGVEVRVSLERCLRQHLGLHLRARELRRRMISRLKRFGVVVEAGDECVALKIEPLDRQRLTDALSEFDKTIEEIAHRPLTGLLVQEALDITGPERLRWTKDGRLRASGVATIRRGQLISLSTYHVGQIGRLAADPTIVAGWRRDDLASVSELAPGLVGTP